jgi:hypothetical protein
MRSQRFVEDPLSSSSARKAASSSPSRYASSHDRDPQRLTRRTRRERVFDEPLRTHICRSALPGRSDVSAGSDVEALDLDTQRPSETPRKRARPPARVPQLRNVAAVERTVRSRELATAGPIYLVPRVHLSSVGAFLSP